jgi:hypothetical protein
LHQSWLTIQSGITKVNTITNFNFLIPVLIATTLVVGCRSADDTPLPVNDVPIVTTPPDTMPDATIFAPSPTDLILNRSTYQQDGYSITNVIRVDVRTQATSGPCTEDDLSGCTLADVMADVDKNDELKVDIPVHFSSDDFADDGSVSNAELRLRGGGSRFAPQKSFRIKLDSKEVLWRQERHLQLNKHPFDSLRIRNKLAFDMMSEVPHLPSMRTQFVNLWIDDAGNGPEDYGLFTHVERPNDLHLKKHGLDEDGNLYKAEDFRFDKSDLLDIAVNEDGKPLDKDRFESSLEIEEGKDHRSLVAMMSALHDPDRSFDSVLEQYFNRNNVTAWMAVNILLQQADATRHNYLLYNPSGTEKFYFIPWDYDAAMGTWQEPPNSYDADALRERLEYGHAVGAMNVFTSRYYRQPGMHTQILAAVDYIRQNYITDSLITERAALYASLVEAYEARAPDSEHNEFFSTSSAAALAENPAKNEQALKTSFSIPMPPVLLEPILDSTQWLFSWEPAYDVTGHDISYDLQISTTLAFAADDITIDITGIEDSSVVVNQRIEASQLPAGEYYTRLTARVSSEPNRFWQVASNIIEVDGLRHFGVIQFTAP